MGMPRFTVYYKGMIVGTYAGADQHEAITAASENHPAMEDNLDGEVNAVEVQDEE